MKKYQNTFVVVATILAVGCASQPKDIATQSVSPLIYQDYDCYQIASELDRIGTKTGELYGSLKKTADNDAAQMGVGLVLFWPTLFFLEGGDGPEAAEYARLKGEYEALQKAALMKRCETTAPKPITAYIPTETNPSTQGVPNKSGESCEVIQVEPSVWETVCEPSMKSSSQDASIKSLGVLQTQPASSYGTLDTIEEKLLKLDTFHKKGLITDLEYAEAKQKLLNNLLEANQPGDTGVVAEPVTSRRSSGGPCDDPDYRLGYPGSAQCD